MDNMVVIALMVLGLLIVSPLISGPEQKKNVPGTELNAGSEETADTQDQDGTEEDEDNN